MSVNAGNAFPSLFSEVPEVSEVFYLLGCFFVVVVPVFSFLKPTEQLLKNKLLREIYRFLLGNSLIAERCALIALVVQKLNVKKPRTVVLSPG